MVNMKIQLNFSRVHWCVKNLDSRMDRNNFTLQKVSNNVNEKCIQCGLCLHFMRHAMDRRTI